MYGINSYADIVHYVEMAVGEMAYNEYAKDDFPELFARAKRNNIRDIPGWMADELYNDSDTVNDLVGDKLYDLITTKWGEDPMKPEVWNKHIAAVNLLMPHVLLKSYR